MNGKNPRTDGEEFRTKSLAVIHFVDRKLQATYLITVAGSCHCRRTTRNNDFIYFEPVGFLFGRSVGRLVLVCRHAFIHSVIQQRRLNSTDFHHKTTTTTIMYGSSTGSRCVADDCNTVWMRGVAGRGTSGRFVARNSAAATS